MVEGMTFKKLNDAWNAEPNAPDERVIVYDDRVELSFILNPWEFEASEGEIGRLLFEGCAQWRLGPTNDEGWYRGQCRYSKTAPDWGEFYEIIGPDSLVDQPDDWHALVSAAPGRRHFLFYLRDTTFECIAKEWAFKRQGKIGPTSA